MFSCHSNNPGCAEEDSVPCRIVGHFQSIDYSKKRFGKMPHRDRENCSNPRRLDQGVFAREAPGRHWSIARRIDGISLGPPRSTNQLNDRTGIHSASYLLIIVAAYSLVSFFFLQSDETSAFKAAAERDFSTNC
jgi:hypothetical protein